MSIWRVVTTIHHPSLGGIGTNTWHVRAAGEIETVGTTLADATGWIETFFTTCQSVFPSGCEVRYDGTAAGVGPDEGQFATTDPWTMALSSSSGPLPPATAICVNWRGQSGDRSRRGRSFIGPVSTDAIDTDGTIVGGVLAIVRDAAAALVDSSDSFANGALGVWSRQEQVIRDFVASSVTDQFAVLRSRRD